MPEQQWRREGVTPEAEATLLELHRESVLEHFYLAGGTGLAVQLGHRRSRDLDLFSSERFDPDALLQKVQQLREFSLVGKETGTLHAHIGGTRVSFFSYAYPVLFPLQFFGDVRVADPRDIGGMKISAIAGRGTKRDFVDFYSVSKQYGLSHLLDLFKQKYAQANYSILHVLKSLTYFEDAEKDPMPEMLAPLSWDEVKQFFVTEVPRFL